MSTGLTPGATIAGFRIESALGRGAMAQVYRAQDARGDWFALKLLDTSLAQDERFRQRFLRESEIAAGLHHPNIVPTIDSGEEGGALYLVMKLVEGSDLRQILRTEGRLDPERAVDIVDQAASALDAAHKAGLVHRDVKPGNLLVEPGIHAEQVYVCDFGLARHASSPSSLTGDRGFVGTIDYVPPEQIEGATVDARADVYSLGCVLFECLTGERPFERDSELSVVFAHLNEPPPRATDIRADLPAAFDEVFATALAKSPDERYSSCGELAAAARAARRGEVLAPRRQRSRLLVAAVAAAVAAVAAIVAVVASRGAGSHTPHVTITPTSIQGARLGDSTFTLTKLWGVGGSKLLLTTPPDYAALAQRNRNLSAYFVGTTDRAVEITTRNSTDRTAEGIGPCSPLADLKRVYGTRLKPIPNNVHNGIVGGWQVGKMIFEMGPFPGVGQVQTVAIHSDDLGSAAYNASNEGPCSTAAINTVVARPRVIPKPRSVALTTSLASKRFVPFVSLRAPPGWTTRLDTKRELTIGSAGGTTVDFRLDPRAVDAKGSPLQNVSITAAGVSALLGNEPTVTATPPLTTRIGRNPVLTVTSLDVAPRTRAGAPYLAFPASTHLAPLQSLRGHHVRVYLAPIRIDTTVHAMSIAIDAPSLRAFRAVAPALDAMLRNLELDAAAGPSLSALSSFCTSPWNGTCLGELTAGTHSTRTFMPALTYTVPLDWTNSGDMAGFVGLIPPGGDYQAVDLGKSDYINIASSVAAAKDGCGVGPSKIHTPAAFAHWLTGHPGLTANEAPVRIGGLAGVVVDVRMRSDWQGTCQWSHGVPDIQILDGLDPSPTQLAHDLLPPPSAERLYLLNYKGGTLGIEVVAVKGPAKLAAYDKVVRSFRFKLR